jgi:pilus assembly protein CpaF
MSSGGALCVDRVRKRVADDPALAEAADGPTRLATIRSAVARAVREEGLLLAPDALAATVREVADALAGLGPVQALLRDPEVTDVMVNGPDEVWVERSGRLERTPVRFSDAEAVRAAVLRVVGPLGLRLDRARPFVDARLPDGSRLHALLPPLAPGGPVVTVRKFAPVQPSWEDLAASTAVPAEVAALLRAAVADRRVITCCGRTGKQPIGPQSCMVQDGRHANRRRPGLPFDATDEASAGVLRLAGAVNIAAGLRWAARAPVRALALLGL